MKKEQKGKSYVPVIVGTIIALLLLGLLAAMFAIFGRTGTPKPTEGTSEPTEQTDEPTEPPVAEPYDLYWNVDRDAFAGQSGTGRTGREPGADGTYKVRFFKDGEMLEFTVADRRTMNQIDTQYLWGFEVDGSGLITEVVSIDDLPCTKLAWQNYVKSTGGRKVIANTSEDYQGMSVEFDMNENTGVYDMTGVSGEPGTPTNLQVGDRIFAVKNTLGEVTHVFVYVREGLIKTKVMFCEHCKEEVTWKNWYKDGKLPTTEGHYFLDEDIVLTGQMSMQTDQQICLDLNGYTVTGAENARIYSLHNPGTRLAIFDTSEEKTGRMIAGGEKCAQGSVVWVRYGRFDLYGGTLDGKDVVSNVNGATVSVPAGAGFYMHGGTIIGGTATYAINSETGVAGNGMGGAVSVAGTFVMEDGVIRDGRAVCYHNTAKNTYSQGYAGNVLVIGGTMTMTGGIIQNGRAEGGGGNVYVVSKGTVNLEGGTITGGNAVQKGKNGGNMVIATGCTLNMSGGTIQYGTTRNYAGNVQVMGTMNMSGGTITGGRCINYGTGEVNENHTAKNLFLVDCTFNMSGGRITGSVAVTDSAKDDGKKPVVTLSGAPVITGAEEGRNNLQLNTSNDGYTLKLGTLWNGAKIGITAMGKFSGKTMAANAAYFFPDKAGAEINYFEDCLFMGKVHCLCGATDGNHFGECTGELLGWGSWTNSGTLPTADGYYHLTQDMTVSQGNVAANAHVCLDLNGKTVTGREGGRVYTTFNEGASLTITDSSEEKTGKLVAVGKSSNQGLLVWVRYGSFTMYGGTLDGSEAVSMLNGAGIRVDGNTTATMYGGTVIGGTAAFSSAGSNGNGGGVYINGTFNLINGTITGGQSEGFGGNVYIAGGGKMSMSGGAITNGKNTVKSGNGGNVFLAGGGTFDLSGGVIRDGRTQNMAGNIEVVGTMNMSGGTVTGGMRYQVAEDGTVTETTYYNGNVFVVNGVMKMSGGVIDGHMRVQDTRENGSTFTVSGSARITGGANNENLSFVGSAGGSLPTVNIEGTLSENALISLDASGFFSGETVEENCDNFEAKSGIAITYVDNKLAVGLLKHCICGAPNGGHIGKCDGTELYWKPWTETNKLPTTDANVLGDNTESGYYLYVDEVTLTGGNAVSGAANILLDLNGKTVTLAADGGARIYQLNYNGSCSLTITDTSAEQTGKIVRSGSVSSNQGTMVWIRYGNQVLNLYGGTLDASGVTCTFGAPIDISGGSMNIYGGTIIGGSAANGGAIRTLSTTNMSGGTIIGGTATNGGAVYVQGGSFTMTGGEIIGGTATNGGAVYNAGTFTVNGGTITGSTVSGNGGAVYNTGTVNVNGGAEINGGSAVLGGAIYNNAGKITVQNSTITVPDDAKVTRGGAIYSGGSGAAVTLNDGSVVRGNDKTTVTNGGAVALYGGTLTVNEGAEIIGGKATSGGALSMNGGTTTATLNGGTITGGEATNGGAIYFNGNAKFTMEKGTVSGGKAKSGGTFYIAAPASTTLTVNGGKIIGGEATDCDTIWSEGTVKVNGGTITGGILAGDGTVNISGNPIIEGSGITVSAGKKITVGEMAEGAIVNITMAADGIFAETAEGFQPEHTGYFHVAGENTEGRSIYYIEGEGLYIGKYGCEICGGAYDKCEEEHLNKDSEKIKWIAWTNNAALPRTNQAAADGFDGKHFYLIGDVTVGSFGSVTTADIELYLDLNGKTVAYSADTANRIYQLNAANGTLTITDTGEDGKFIRSGIVGSTQGSAIWVQNASTTLNLYGGTFDFSGVTCTFGAPLDVAGKLNIYGGTIIGGHGANGGAVRCTGAATITMENGLIYGGQASGLGDNIHVAGTAVIKGGAIAGGVYNAGAAAKLKIAGEDLISVKFVEEINANLPEGTEPYYVPTYDIQGAYTVDETLTAASAQGEGAISQTLAVLSVAAFLKKLLS